MMKRMLAGALILALSTSMGRALAQEGCARMAGGSSGDQLIANPNALETLPVSGIVAGQRGVQGERTANYSYWVSPGSARTYVPYAAVDQFPFRGRPYGNPTDRWSWYYMGGGNARYLARYYYPLLP